jgi:hypothetical protein
LARMYAPIAPATPPDMTLNLVTAKKQRAQSQSSTTVQCRSI